MNTPRTRTKTKTKRETKTKTKTTMVFLSSDTRSLKKGKAHQESCENSRKQKRRRITTELTNLKFLCWECQDNTRQRNEFLDNAMGLEKSKTWAYKNKKKAQDGENRGGRQRRRTRKASCQNRRNVCQSQIHAHCHCRSQSFFFRFVYLYLNLCALMPFYLNACIYIPGSENEL